MGRIFDLFFGITIFKYIFSQELNFFRIDGIILGALFRRQGAENANQIKIVFTIIYIFFEYIFQVMKRMRLNHFLLVFTAPFDFSFSSFVLGATFERSTLTSILRYLKAGSLFMTKVLFLVIFCL